LKFFSESELNLLNGIILKSEEMVADYLRLSTSDWKKLRYDFRTLKDLLDHEITNGPFAQVMKYDAKPWGSSLASSGYTIYRICIQDDAVIDRLHRYELLFESFLHYIAVHELVHVVRFSKYIKKFEANKEEMEMEEDIVHDLTKKIMEKSLIPDRFEIFNFFGKSERFKTDL